MAKPKKQRNFHVPEKLLKNVILPEWDEITRCWAELENAAIDVAEDLGLKSFGGEKIKILYDAVMSLRIARCKEDARELMRIAKEGDRTKEAEQYVKMIRTLAQKIVDAEQKRTKKEEQVNWGGKHG